MSSPYPRDDFDAVTPPRDGRRGAHRAAPKRSTGFVAPVVIALVVAVAGGAGYLALSPTSGSSASASTDTAGAEGADAAAGDDAAAVDDAAGSDGTDDAAGTDGGTPSAAPSPDQSVPVVVLNGTGTKGLAATTATTLEGAGWTVSSTGNATQAQRTDHQGTTVLYPAADLEATATALATTLGGAAALDEDAAAGSITVVLLP